MLLPEGCHRCRTLRTECSLSTIGKVSDGLSSPLSERQAEEMTFDSAPCPPLALPSRYWAGIESASSGQGAASFYEPWMQRVESMLRLAFGQGLFATGSERDEPSLRSLSLPEVPRGVRPDGVGDGDDFEPAIKRLLQSSLGTSLLMVTGLNIHDRGRLICPIEEGLVSRDHFKSIYSTSVYRLLPNAAG